jgi:hypothetical protein
MKSGALGAHEGANLDAPSSLDGVPAAPLQVEPPAALVRR